MLSAACCEAVKVFAEQPERAEQIMLRDFPDRPSAHLAYDTSNPVPSPVNLPLLRNLRKNYDWSLLRQIRELPCIPDIAVLTARSASPLAYTLQEIWPQATPVCLDIQANSSTSREWEISVLNGAEYFPTAIDNIPELTEILRNKDRRVLVIDQYTSTGLSGFLAARVAELAGATAIWQVRGLWYEELQDSRYPATYREEQFRSIGRKIHEALTA